MFVPQDLHTINLEPYQYGGTNITGVRMVDPNSKIVQSAVKNWGYLEARKGRNIGISSENITVCVILKL